MSLPPATLSSVPIYDYAVANEELVTEPMETYYPCCGKNICRGCAHSFRESGNYKCPFCNSNRGGKTDEENVEEIMKRVEANDAVAMGMLGYITREYEVFSRITPRQWNYLLSQQSLVVVRHIAP
jgi:hypothetical protein